MPGVAAELLPGAVRPNQRETKEPERPPADLGEAASPQDTSHQGLQALLIRWAASLSASPTLMDFLQFWLQAK